MEGFCNSLGDIKRISNSNKKLYEAPTTVVDIEDAIKKMNFNKSPDNDGLASEFLKICFPEILWTF